MVEAAFLGKLVLEAAFDQNSVLEAVLERSVLDSILEWRSVVEETGPLWGGTEMSLYGEEGGGSGERSICGSGECDGFFKSCRVCP